MTRVSPAVHAGHCHMSWGPGPPMRVPSARSHAPAQASPNRRAEACYRSSQGDGAFPGPFHGLAGDSAAHRSAASRTIHTAWRPSGSAWGNGSRTALPTAICAPSTLARRGTCGEATTAAETPTATTTKRIRAVLTPESYPALLPGDLPHVVGGLPRRGLAAEHIHRVPEPGGRPVAEGLGQIAHRHRRALGRHDRDGGGRRCA
jgi:hypothetical protein